MKSTAVVCNKEWKSYKQSKLNSSIAQKSQYVLYFGRSLYRRFWIKWVEIHKILKEFWKLFQMRPTAVVCNKELKSYKQSKLNGSIAQKRRYLLYFGRSLYRCFWTKWVEIHEILKEFWKLFQMRPTEFVCFKVYRIY